MRKMYSIKMRLFLKALPFARLYNSWYLKKDKLFSLKDLTEFVLTNACRAFSARDIFSTIVVKRASYESIKLFLAFERLPSPYASRSPCGGPFGEPRRACGSVLGNEQRPVFEWSDRLSPNDGCFALNIKKIQKIKYEEKNSSFKAAFFLTRIGVRNFCRLIWIQPNFLLPAF